MSTTIDTLQVEIQSSSTNAAKGIQELSTALAGLKANGKITTAVNNLNNLRKALHSFSNTPSSASKVLSLASSLEKLKSVGSVATVGNSLAKLAGSLKTLNTVSVDKGKIDSIADSLSSLSAVKAGGINTMMNGLMKIGKVTKELNDDAINAFADRVGKLTEKLSPLSEKMTSIQAGLKGINSSARSAGGGVKNMSEEVDGASVNLSSFIYIVQEAVQWLQTAIQKFSEFMQASIEWDGIHHQFGNAFGEQADEYYKKVEHITEALKINKQNFMEMTAMASSMLVGFGVTESDAREMGLGYTELAYDIWAAFNNVYKTLDGADGAMAAVRSAIAGEVEPIRRAGFTIVDSQLAITAANYGLAYSSATATEAQKSYLRYLTLVDQAKQKGIIGTYASEMNKAEGMVRTFTQQLKSLSQAFGSLFLPILVKVMPYLQAFVELLTEAVHRIAEFFGVEIQSVDFSGYSDGVGGMADSTDKLGDTAANTAKKMKELKNAAIGIDELNVISPPTASSGSGGSSGDGGNGYDVPVSSIWDKAIFDSIKTETDAIKEKLRGWLPVIGAVAGALAALRLTKLILDIKEAFDGLKKLLGVTGGSAAFAGFLTKIKEYIAAVKLLAPEVGLLAAMFPKLSGWFATIGTTIAGAAKAVAAFVAGISAGVWAGIVAIVAALASVVYFLYQNWEEVTQAFKDFFAENIGPKLEEIKGHFDKIAEALEPIAIALKPVFDWFKKLFDIVVDFIKNIDWGAILAGLGEVVEFIGGVFFTNFFTSIMGLFNALVGVFENLTQILSGFIQTVRGVIDLVVALFSGGDIEAAAQKIVDGIFDVFSGLVSLVIDPIIDFFVGAVSWFEKLWDVLVGHSIVPDTVNAIVKWFTSLPSKIFSSIDKFVTGIIDKFKGMWSKLVGWWNSKTKLKEYTPSIGSIYDKLKSRWDSARTWWNGKKSKLSEYTPSIGSIYDKLSTRWKNARDWWNKKKGSMSYTPSIGSITDRLKSAWNAAKKWWNSNVKLSIPSLSFKVTYSNSGLNMAQKAIVKALDLNGWPKLSFAANGGIFDQGSLVWAGERGPEVVANAAGGKTGVMNVQQMRDAVYEGVYAAVVAGMRTSGDEGGNRVVQVVLPDGRVLASSVEKAQRERGANIMGNQVFGY